MNSSPEPRAHCILALDFGLRRIGIATANSVTGTASTLTTLSARDGEPDWSTLDKLITEWKPDVLVLGLPYNTDGTASDFTDRVRLFEQQLTNRYKLRIATTDETYTSVEAQALLKTARQQGIKSRRVGKEDVDSLAAKLIAERWLSTQAQELDP